MLHLIFLFLLHFLFDFSNLFQSGLDLLCLFCSCSFLGKFLSRNLSWASPCNWILILLVSRMFVGIGWTRRHTGSLRFEGHSWNFRSSSTFCLFVCLFFFQNQQKLSLTCRPTVIQSHLNCRSPPHLKFFVKFNYCHLNASPYCHGLFQLWSKIFCHVPPYPNASLHYPLAQVLSISVSCQYPNASPYLLYIS